MACDKVLVLGIKGFINFNVLYYTSEDNREGLELFKQKYYSKDSSIDIFTAYITQRNCHKFDYDSELMKVGDIWIPKSEWLRYQKKYADKMDIGLFARKNSINYIDTKIYHKEGIEQCAQ